MIESIHIKDVATCDAISEKFSGLSKFNFFYGSNGSGKTTITRVIADEEKFPTCKVIWKGGDKLPAMVYNRDFVTHNFGPDVELKGIFTLGEKNVETLEKITAAKVELDALKQKIENLNGGLQGQDGLGGKKSALRKLEEKFRDQCWKQKHDAKLSSAFEGFRNSAEKFKEKVLQEREGNFAALESLTFLEERAATIFGTTPTTEQSISSIDPKKVVVHEFDAILKKRVIGKEDVDIAAMIKKLGNSDWVKEGRTFYEANETVCPFCQQSTSDTFSNSLNEYFDETFITDSKTIDDLATNYQTDSEQLQQQIASIIATPSKFLDIEKLKLDKELLDSKVTINIQKLSSKKKEPSQIVELESIGNVASTINALIATANALITDHNKVVDNLAQERRDLTSKVWKYLLEEELKTDLEEYDTERNSLNKAIKSMTEQIQSAETEKKAKAAEIQALEKEVTSIQPTINEINGLLKSFGFEGFSLAMADNRRSYKLIRQDGTDAKETLSEGEKTFVTFLYFYHLLKGSDAESEMTRDRIVVFDDPVSSLDSDVLFIVGSLIKGLFDEVRLGKGHMKQIFIFTHNVYFHKEVTFTPPRKKRAKHEETFWVVRKSDSISKLDKYGSNPIKTSYELLWSEIQRKDHSTLTIQNTLRRILENYFKNWEGLDPDKICAEFDGNEKMVCKSLYSWVNDGSHSVHDDLCVSINESTVATYLEVFRLIFEKTDHFSHYQMMMRNSDVELSMEEASA